MTKIEMLFIRACKSPNPKQRVLSVYRRFYRKTTNYVVIRAMACILLNMYFKDLVRNMQINIHAREILVDKCKEIQYPIGTRVFITEARQGYSGLFTVVSSFTTDHNADNPVIEPKKPVQPNYTKLLKHYGRTRK